MNGTRVFIERNAVSDSAKTVPTKRHNNVFVEAEAGSGPRIVGGFDAYPGEFPYQVRDSAYFFYFFYPTRKERGVMEAWASPTREARSAVS